MGWPEPVRVELGVPELQADERGRASEARDQTLGPLPNGGGRPSAKASPTGVGWRTAVSMRIDEPGPATVHLPLSRADSWPNRRAAGPRSEVTRRGRRAPGERIDRERIRDVDGASRDGGRGVVGHRAGAPGWCQPRAGPAPGGSATRRVNGRSTIPLVVVGAALLVGWTLRLHDLNAQSFWYDEGTSATVAPRAVSTIVANAAADIHPPLYYLSLHAWAPLGGLTEFGLRFPSVLVGTLTLAFTYRLGRDALDADRRRGRALTRVRAPADLVQ